MTTTTTLRPSGFDGAVRQDEVCLRALEDVRRVDEAYLLRYDLLANLRSAFASHVASLSAG